MNTFLYVFLGGGLGSIARFGVSKIITSDFQQINPVSTLISNVVSTTMLGITLLIIGNRIDLSTPFKLFMITGFCGGFSTFSTFSFETFALLRSGHTLMAVLNIFISVLLGLFVLYFISKTVS